MPAGSPADADLRLHRRKEGMCRVAGNGEHPGPRLFQEPGPGDEGWSWILTVRQQRVCPVRNCGVRPDQDLKMLLIARGGRRVHQFEVEIRRRFGTHPAKDPHDAPGMRTGFQPATKWRQREEVHGR